MAVAGQYSRQSVLRVCYGNKLHVSRMWSILGVFLVNGPRRRQSYSSFPMSGAKTLNKCASRRYYGACSDVKLALRC